MALLNAGNTLGAVKDAQGNAVRVPHGAQINFAQRADLLAPLLGHAEIDMDGLRAEWGRSFVRLPRETMPAKCNFDFVFQNWRETALKPDSEPRILVDEKTSLIARKNMPSPRSANGEQLPASAGLGTASFDLPIGQKRAYLVYAISDSATQDIDLLVRRTYEAKPQGEYKPLNSAADPCPYANVEATAEDDWTVFVVEGEMAEAKAEQDQ